MEKKKLFIVKFNYVDCSFKETRCAVAGDWDNTYNVKNYKPSSIQFFGVFSEEKAKEYLKKDGFTHVSVYAGETDYMGSCKCSVYVSGYYYTVDEQELEVSIIDGKQYAKYNDSFIEIDVKANQQESSMNF